MGANGLADISSHATLRPTATSPHLLNRATSGAWRLGPVGDFGRGDVEHAVGEQRQIPRRGFDDGVQIPSAGLRRSVNMLCAPPLNTVSNWHGSSARWIGTPSIAINPER